MSSFSQITNANANAETRSSTNTARSSVSSQSQSHKAHGLRAANDMSDDEQKMHALAQRLGMTLTIENKTQHQNQHQNQHHGAFPHQHRVQRSGTAPTTTTMASTVPFPRPSGGKMSFKRSSTTSSTSVRVRGTGIGPAQAPHARTAFAHANSMSIARSSSSLSNSSDTKSSTSDSSKDSDKIAPVVNFRRMASGRIAPVNKMAPLALARAGTTGAMPRNTSTPWTTSATPFTSAPGTAPVVDIQALKSECKKTEARNFFRARTCPVARSALKASQAQRALYRKSSSMLSESGAAAAQMQNRTATMADLLAAAPAPFVNRRANTVAPKLSTTAVDAPATVARRESKSMAADAKKTQENEKNETATKNSDAAPSLTAVAFSLSAVAALTVPVLIDMMF